MNLSVRLLALLSLCMLLAGSARGQHAFQAILPGLTPALKRPVLQTPDGGFVLLAEEGQDTLKFPDGTISLYAARTVILKTDPNGNVGWSRSLAEPSGHRVYPVTVRATPDGGFLVLANAIEKETQRQFILLYRLDAYGFPLWSRTFNSNAQEAAWGGDVVQFDDGSAVIAGALFLADNFVRRVDSAFRSPAESRITEGVYTRKSWVGLVFGIDSEGEVVWSRMLDSLPERSVYERVHESFAAAIVRRGDNRATIAISLNHFLWHTSSLLVTLNTKGDVTDEPVWMRTWETPLSGSEATSYDDDNRLDINDMVLLPDGGLAVSGAIKNRDYYPLTGFLCMFDSTTTPTVRHTYPNARHTGPFTFSLHPFDDHRFLAAGRTPLVNGYDGVNGYDDGLDEPTIGLIDADGSLREIRRMTTPVNEVLPIPEETFGPAGSYLDQPHFAVTWDASLISIGTIRTKEDRSRRTLFLARFNPDFTGCSEATEEAARFEMTEPQQADYEWFGRSGFPDPDDYPMQARPFHYSCTNLWRIERMKDSAGWEKEMRNMVAGCPGEAEYVALTPHWHKTSPADVQNPPAKGPDLPIIDRMKITFADAAVGSTGHPLPEVEELKITPWFLCGGAPIADAPADREITAAEYLRLMPNSLPKGNRTNIEFRIAGGQKPTVELVDAGRGETVRRLAEKEIAWNGTTGSATVNTDGLPAGIYLVRVRSGEKQLTAKLEVR